MRCAGAYSVSERCLACRRRGRNTTRSRPPLASGVQHVPDRVRLAKVDLARGRSPVAEGEGTVRSKTILHLSYRFRTCPEACKLILRGLDPRHVRCPFVRFVDDYVCHIFARPLNFRSSSYTFHSIQFSSKSGGMKLLLIPSVQEILTVTGYNAAIDFEVVICAISAAPSFRGFRTNWRQMNCKNSSRSFVKLRRSKPCAACWIATKVTRNSCTGCSNALASQILSLLRRG